MNYIKIEAKKGDFICSGEQLKEVLLKIKSYIKDSYFYFFDVQTVSGGYLAMNCGNMNSVCEFTSLEGILEKVMTVDQFISGVLIISQKKLDTEKMIPIDTEYDMKMQLSSALIEIRMFDTSWFECYTENEAITKELKKISF